MNPVARRLVEQGVRSIEVNLNDCDSHANNCEARQTDAALLKDLKERDLLDSTVVLGIGEFGRTPNINPFDGRDHWPKGFSCLVGGGGMKQGVVIRESDPEGAKPDPTDPIEVKDLYATVLHLFGVPYQNQLDTSIGRPVPISEGQASSRADAGPSSKSSTGRASGTRQTGLTTA